MDNLALYKLVGEVKQQCRFGQFAFREVRNTLQALDSEKVFFYVHALLQHCTVLCGLLWPVRSESQARGEQLRKALKLGEDSPLRLATIRGQLTNEDERLEDWISGLESPNYVDMNVMAQGTMAGFKSDSFHRSLDPENFKLRLRGAECELRRVADELRRVESVSETWLRTHNPW